MVKKYSKPVYLDAVKEKIEKNFYEPINVPELAREAGVSESKLQHDFPEAFGITMQQFQTEIRIDLAKHLLEDLNLSIEQIANKIGYKNTSNFTHAFKRQTGMGPNEYRNR